jgi:hypothetical protein
MAQWLQLFFCFAASGERPIGELIELHVAAD